MAIKRPNGMRINVASAKLLRPYQLPPWPGSAQRLSGHDGPDDSSFPDGEGRKATLDDPVWDFGALEGCIDWGSAEGIISKNKTIPLLNKLINPSS